jgi:hypothetical protein
MELSAHSVQSLIRLLIRPGLRRQGFLRLVEEEEINLAAKTL